MLFIGKVRVSTVSEDLTNQVEQYKNYYDQKNVDWFFSIVFIALEKKTKLFIVGTRISKRFNENKWLKMS